MSCSFNEAAGIPRGRQLDSDRELPADKELQ